MKSRAIAYGASVLMALLISVTANAGLNGVLPATPGGTDWQAFYDDQLDITWANIPLGTSKSWADQMAWVAAVEINGVTGWRLPNLDVNGDGVIATPSDCIDQTVCKDNELGHLFHYGAGTAQTLGVTPDDMSPFDLLISQGADIALWSLTEVPSAMPPSPSAWIINYFGSGNVFQVAKTYNAFGWAVLDGNPEAEAEPVSVPAMPLWAIAVCWSLVVGIWKLRTLRRRYG